MVPLFLFSATFYPLSVYSPAARWIVQLTPLYHGVVLCRAFSTGELSWGLLGQRRLPAGHGGHRAGRQPAAGSGSCCSSNVQP